MIFPFILLIADICLWYLFGQVALLDNDLLGIAAFGLAFGVFIWVILEALSLVNAGTDLRSEDEE